MVDWGDKINFENGPHAEFTISLLKLRILTEVDFKIQPF